MEDKFYYNSPYGVIEFSIENNYLTSLRFVKKFYLKDDTSFSKTVKKQLDEYFLAKRKKFNLKIKLNGTPFQKAVWEELIKIPYGKTLTYADIAQNIHNKNAYRAVALACKNNPILIIIPCHRVVSKVNLGGYVAGNEIKKSLLNLEK